MPFCSKVIVQTQTQTNTQTDTQPTDCSAQPLKLSVTRR